MPWSPAHDDFPPDSARGDDEIIGPLPACLDHPWEPPGVQFQVRPRAGRTRRPHDYKVSVDSEPLVRPPRSSSRSPSLQDRARADVDMIPLVIEIGAPADELEVGEDVLVQPPHPSGPGAVDVIDEADFRRGRPGARTGLIGGGPYCGLLDEVDNSHQGQAVFEVICEDLLLPAVVTARLPPPAPHDALDRRGNFRPLEAEQAADVLEAIGVGAEVEMGVDYREDVDKR
jgi:hypothetical protein